VVHRQIVVREVDVWRVFDLVQPDGVVRGGVDERVDAGVDRRGVGVGVNLQVGEVALEGTYRPVRWPAAFDGCVGQVDDGILVLEVGPDGLVVAHVGLDRLDVRVGWGSGSTLVSWYPSRSARWSVMAVPTCRRRQSKSTFMGNCSG